MTGRRALRQAAAKLISTQRNTTPRAKIMATKRGSVMFVMTEVELKKLDILFRGPFPRDGDRRTVVIEQISPTGETAFRDGKPLIEIEAILVATPSRIQPSSPTTA